jgi:hypothetical protein
VLFTAQVRTLQLVVNVAVGGLLPTGSGWVVAVAVTGALLLPHLSITVSVTV